ncbi:DUF805 domain-containing protein [Miltoncostaea oceani]|uniref:DUF805 domain-containing protein n=1 Tax=Miltoncostaea oceani TaxID=2843216 RepID=UPI001C3DE048|nr:DUF805 domain-containing protein [Miltoncostaea oceani]
MRWYLAVLRRYTGFHDRAHRTEFWMFTVWSTVATVALFLLDTILGTGKEWPGLFGLLYGVTTAVPSLAVGARRLHDTGRSGWWQLIALVPIVGLIVLIVWWATEGDGAQNQWGRDPCDDAHTA